MPPIHIPSIPTMHPIMMLVSKPFNGTIAQEVWTDIQDHFFFENNIPRIFQIENDIACLVQDQMTITV